VTSATTFFRFFFASFLSIAAMRLCTKFQVSSSTRTPNLVKISEIAAELWRFYFFSKWRPAAILDFVTGQK